MTLRVALAAFAAFASLAAAAAQAQEAPPASDPVRGKSLYRSTGCWQCHGSAGHGGAWQGPKLAPALMPFESFLFQLRRPMNAMPPYRAAVLSDAQAADIYSYLKSIPEGPAADQIPLLPKR